MDLVVFDLQALDHVVLCDAFAGDEMHVADTHPAPERRFFQRVVEAAAEDGEYIEIAAQAIGTKVAKGGDSLIKNSSVAGEADNFR